MGPSHLRSGAEGPPFLVLALPRSRTRWLSEFLSFPPWRCTHEEARHLRSMEDVKSWAKQPFVGSAETAVGSFWRLIPQDVRVVVVRRGISEVVASLRRVMTCPPSESSLSSFVSKLDSKLTQISSRLEGVLNITYDELGSAEGASRVFEFALGTQMPPEWYALLAPVNIQEPFVTFERYAAAYAPQLRRMASLAKGEILRDMALRAKPIDPSVILVEEPFDKFLHDGVALFAEHANVVGEVPEGFRYKNIPLLRALAAQGSLQVVTARSNGRMFGYLMAEIAPSRESPTRVMATETLYFASGDFPGLGMKLQREALRALRAKGVSEVWFRAGERGAGSRIETMYRRLGASPAGTVWRLGLGGEVPAVEGTP